ncbi:uncharacterized protein BJX67DRAFT_307865 [Aspergillus lucknowensis]|uniref:Uncharacterized protein n=1 Tax=Aspergillus lucknowensis TaxID=176173 RepID=A0ABR4M2R7_9EURO
MSQLTSENPAPKRNTRTTQDVDFVVLQGQTPAARQLLRVLEPALMLDTKCSSTLGRPSESKKNTDADDIIFLLEFCARNQSIGSCRADRYDRRQMYFHERFFGPNSASRSCRPSTSHEAGRMTSPIQSVMNAKPKSSSGVPT